MQAIENICECAEDGILRLNHHSKRPEDIARTIKKLNSICALEHIHTIDISVRALCECGDLWNRLKVFVHKTYKIKNLLLYHHCMNDVDMLIEILCEFKNITNLELVLGNTQHNTDEINKLRKYFDAQTTIKNLKLGSDYCTILDIMELIEFNKSIETIDATIVGIEHVSELISVSMTQKVNKIRFADCFPRPDCMTEFNTFFERFLALNSTIDELDLSSVPLNADTIRIISDFVIEHDGLTTLSVRRCEIYDQKIDILIRALETSNIEKLNIDNNDIEYEGALTIAAMLRTNKSLRVLHIGYNPITYEGIIEILRVLSTNSTVSEFYCTSTDSIVTGETMESVQQTFEQILLDNNVLIHFVVRLTFEFGVTECIKLENITDRNKRAFSELRFTRTKVAHKWQ